MKVAQFIELLKPFQELDMEIMILDGSNGGGRPRDINFGPHRVIITENDAKACGDCEDKIEHTVLVFGYGCY